MKKTRQRILVAGANGLIGSALVKSLLSEDFYVVACYRAQNVPVSKGNSARLQKVFFQNISANTDWREALRDIDCVVHCIGLSEVKFVSRNEAMRRFNYVNRDITANLAKQANEAGVKRFIFLSSIKVNGEKSSADKPFTLDDLPSPQSLYGMSKWNAECALQGMTESSGLSVIIIRSPMVYSPFGKGNVEKLLSLIKTGMPIPKLTDKNKRSFVSIDNLLDFIICCLNNKSAVNRVLLVSDGRDLSTRELVEMLYMAEGKAPKYLPFSEAALRFVLGIFNRNGLRTKLFDSLQIDIKQSQELLGWTPPHQTHQSFREYYSGDRFDT